MWAAAATGLTELPEEEGACKAGKALELGLDGFCHRNLTKSCINK